MIPTSPLPLAKTVAGKAQSLVSAERYCQVNLNTIPRMNHVDR